MGSYKVAIKNQKTWHTYHRTISAPSAKDAESMCYDLFGYNNDYSITSCDGGDSSTGGNFGMGSVIMGGVILMGMSVIASPLVETVTKQVQNIQQMEYVQPNNNVIQHSSHHIDESIPEFFNTEYQEDVVDGLGQDWDN
jgi:hypothetical protein